MGARLLAALRELSPRQAAGQCAFYLVFCAFVGYLADRPEYRYLDPDSAEIRLAVRHTGQLLGECHELSDTAISKLAPNMRNPMVCPRERSPVAVELALDGAVRIREDIAPAGLHNDGISAAYEHFQVRAGRYALRVRIDDDAVHEGFTHELSREIALAAGQSLVIEFDNDFRLYGLRD